jgi:hypothetical protein
MPTRAETVVASLDARATSRAPRPALCPRAHERPPFSRECPGRGRGSPRGPGATLAAEHRAGAAVQSRGQAQGVRPLCSGAVATPGHRPGSAPSAGACRARPVRRQAPPLRSFCPLETPGPSACRVTFSPLVNGTGQLLCAPRQRFALPLGVLPAGQRLRAGGPMAGHQPLALPSQEAAGQGASMPSEAAVSLGGLRREAQEVSSSLRSESLPLSADHGGMRGRGPQEVARTWSRRLTASAALPLSGAAHAWRSASTLKSRTKARERLMLAMTSSGSVPSRRSSRTVGKEPSPCTFATEPRSRKDSDGRTIS